MEKRHSLNPAMRARLTASLVLVLLATAVPQAHAQQGAINMGGRQQRVSATIMPIYQSYEEDGLSASQTSIPITIVAPIGTNLSLSLYASQMSATGDVPSVNGLSDAQFILSYAHRMDAGSLVLSMGTNVPVGKTTLTEEEFTSLIFISQRAYDFRVPSLGQGLGFSPSLTWAMPVGAGSALGIGASYQVRGAYSPFAFRDEEYNPGNEILVTAGFSSRLTTQSVLSLDLAHSLYAADTFGEEEIYEAGAKTTVSALYRYSVRFDEFRLRATYRTRAKNSQLAGDILTIEDTRSIPNQVNLRAAYRKRLSPGLDVTALIEARRFDKTDLFQERTMVDLGIMPSIHISPQASLVGQFIYTLGTISGIEAGAGIAVAL
jgi:hypothetical protein